MRLADLLQCGCGAPWPEEAQPATGAAEAPLGSSAAPRNSRRRRRGGTGSSAFTPWRPSLSAISENGSTAAAAAARDGKVTPGGTGKAKAGFSRRVLPRSHSDDHRYINVSSAVPAFSPTAYLF
ncbi:hypothetical protein Cni_G05152 [Canna indica]|uniref:Uncharacterized protein n=1 Tax=Canna indica TaxID=4628 RepID=A0AAQ3Q4N5_9LILI|nr:hypothetical protein Cni_G05152 [Canna indica]